MHVNIAQFETCISPGQDHPGQLLCCVLLPAQDISAWLHTRSLLCAPSPHVTEQSVHACQVDQRGTSVIYKRM